MRTSDVQGRIPSQGVARVGGGPLREEGRHGLLHVAPDEAVQRGVAGLMIGGQCVRACVRGGVSINVGNVGTIDMMDGWTDGWIDGWMDGLAQGLLLSFTYIETRRRHVAQDAQ